MHMRVNHSGYQQSPSAVNSPVGCLLQAHTFGAVGRAFAHSAYLLPVNKHIASEPAAFVGNLCII